jgi:hypothetical protein
LALLSSSIVVAVAILWSAILVARELKRWREQNAALKAIDLIGMFAPGVAAASEDPRALLTWEPLARSARRILPAAFADLDRAAGMTFPFSAEQVQAAHARWTTDWLAWEKAHDSEYKLRAAAAAAELAQAASPLARARAEAVEREKLELYQRRYEEYVRTSKALQALIH